MKELSLALRYLQNLIPKLQEKILQHKEEATFCPDDLQIELLNCYSAIQTVLAKLGEQEQGLLYAEACKCFIGKSKSCHQISNFEIWTSDKLRHVINNQNSTILYYTLQESGYLLWVLQPGKEIVRFYRWTSQDKVCDISSEIKSQINRFKSTGGDKSHISDTDYENRSLPYKDEDLMLVRKKNLKLKGENDAKTVSEGEQNEDTESKEVEEPQKSPGQVLFRLLVSAVYDILSELEEGSPLTFIPDQGLFDCPFGSLIDWNGKYLNQRFSVTCISNLACLEQATQSEMNWLKLVDDQDFERSQSRLGGISRVLGSIKKNDIGSHCKPGTGNHEETPETMNLRTVSNPRLATSKSLPERGSRSLPTPNTTRTEPKSKPVSRRTKTSQTIDKLKPIRKSTNLQSPSVTPRNISRMCGVDALSTLTGKTWTNTDITTSSTHVTEFQQVCDKDQCVVIGNPKLPEKLSLHDKLWSPHLDLKAADSECHHVAEHFQVDPILGEEATKDRFLKELQTATVLHIATRLCHREGYLVFAPDSSYDGSGPPEQQSFIVTAEEIQNIDMCTKLVVLSGGWGVTSKALEHGGYRLASAFIKAGCQCVLTVLWSVPNIVLQKFYHHFYRSLHSGSRVTAAAREASKILQEDERFQVPAYTCAWQIIGKNTEIDVLHMRHAMLDQKLNHIEEEAATKLEKARLNPLPHTPKSTSKEQNLLAFQECVMTLLTPDPENMDIISHLMELVDGALKRFQIEENNRRTVQLPDSVSRHQGSLRLLKVLGFHFQSCGADVSEPYVVYPQWNKDDLMMPCYEALRAMLEILHTAECAKAISQLLPLSQNVISAIVDLLCITKNASDIQLKVSDVSVKSLWSDSKIHAMLIHAGFHQIGVLLNFNRVPSNRKLLSSCLQLFVSLSLYKSHTFVHKLDVSLLGTSLRGNEGSSPSPDGNCIPSLSPVVLARQQVSISNPWMTILEGEDEMEEKIKLTRSKVDLKQEFKYRLARTKSWHENTISAQANEALDMVGKAQIPPLKVKVVPRSSQACGSVPVAHKVPLTKPETDQRRDYANYVLQQRLGELSLNKRNEIKRLYLPYIVNA